MFKTAGSIIGFVFGIGLTVGLLLTPHLLPWVSVHGAGIRWSFLQILGAASAGLSLLALTLWMASRIIRGADSWRETKVIVGAALIAVVANTLYSFMVELFAFGSGMRALVAVLGVPVIYGNLVVVLGKTGLKESMMNLFSGALMTMGAGFIIVALIRGW
jgi:hypothetical protein